ncbi:MAG: aminotransferase class V-fold PLP-dependent enzyme [bacterium]|nr:aminotransferase class V-fold PLP-dependent enzyme [bacterium]
MKEVSENSFQNLPGIQKFEVGTPHIIGAVSLLKALEYIENVGGYEAIQEHENDLTHYSLKLFAERKIQAPLLGSYQEKNRLAIFSFSLPQHPNVNRTAEKFAKQNVCIRAGGHCAHPLHHKNNILGSLRMSLYIYNTISDVDKFFTILDQILQE